MPGTDRQSLRLSSDPQAILPISLWAGLAIMDTAVWSRWLSGAMIVALPTALVWITAAMLAVTSLAALILWRQAECRLVSRPNWLPELATLLLPLLWGIIVGWGTSPFALGGLFALWGLLIVSVGLVSVWGPVESEGEAASGERRGNQISDDHRNSTSWQRRVLVEDGEMIEGGALVQFAPGQKEAVLHLAFCPPLAAPPVIHAEDGDGSELEFRTEAAHTFGARLSIRRSSGVETAESRDIEYAAVPPGLQSV